MGWSGLKLSSGMRICCGIVTDGYVGSLLTPLCYSAAGFITKKFVLTSSSSLVIGERLLPSPVEDFCF